MEEKKLGARGQVAIFIIMAIFIGAAVILFFTLGDSFNKKVVGGGAGRVHNFVKSCADEVYLDALYDVGIKGGYYNSPVDSISFGIPVYKNGKVLNMPSSEKIEREIVNSFDGRLKNCVGNFSSFVDMKIVADEPSSMAKVKDEEVILNIIYPMKISKGEKVEELREFGEIRIPSHIGFIYKIAQDIAESEDIDAICLTCLAKIADENDLKIDVVDYDKDVILIVISYEELNGDIFEFSFAMRK